MSCISSYKLECRSELPHKNYRKTSVLALHSVNKYVADFFFVDWFQILNSSPGITTISSDLTDSGQNKYQARSKGLCTRTVLNAIWCYFASISVLRGYSVFFLRNF